MPPPDAAAIHARTAQPEAGAPRGPVRVLSTGPDEVRDRALPAIRAGPATRVALDPATLVPAPDAGVGPDVLLDLAVTDPPVPVRSADQGSFTTVPPPDVRDTP
ncbi:hypothetical protein [Embleya scabrispora]|uniref:hypothetical protein n=1 Tax=Embleya scabrispora TaxID=159449 RepID=UPI00131A3BBD|nr:hypothetical protein [Embleya scabrispora]MYS79112.1 hypothetical protein [Streptomyces sp. SID5474]